MIRFDQSLNAVCDAIVACGLRNQLESGDVAVLRDASGLLTIVDRNNLSLSDRQLLQGELAGIPSYVDQASPIIRPSEIFDEALALRASYRERLVPLTTGGQVSVLYLDRRIVGGDWLSPAREKISDREIPIIVFASLKGGVGRSTALAVAAKHLSSLNLRVLCVDLDLEAPGIGSMLLPAGGRSKYGTLDYYAEHGQSSFVADVEFLDLMEASNLAGGGAPIYVAPAFGSSSLENPNNIIGKLSRAYIEDVDDDGNVLSFLDRTRMLLSGLTRARDFDVILVDSRAGLHETVAAPILGLNADVLLFGIDQPQTFEGYRALLAQLETIAKSDKDFTLRLRMVNSKADRLNPEGVQNFTDRSHDMFREFIYGEAATSVEQFEADADIWYNVDDRVGPHFPWVIPESDGFRLFDPQSQKNIFEEEIYTGVFGEFLLALTELINTKVDV